MASNQHRQPTFDDPGVDDPRALSERQQWLGWLTNLIDGAMLGWGDEATAGILSNLDPNSPGYEAELNQFRRHQDRYKEQNPVKSYATQGLGFLGGMAAGAPRGAMVAAENMLPRVFSRGLPAGIGGYLAGSVGEFRPDQDLPSRTPGAGNLAVASSGIGAMAPVWGAGLGGAGGKVAIDFNNKAHRPNMVSSSIHGRHTPKGKPQRPKRTTYTDEELELMYNPQAYPLKKYGEKKKGK